MMSDGDSAELDRLYREWGPNLIKYLRRNLQDSRGLAEDIAHDAFLILWRRWPDVRNHPCPRAWLYTVARHLLIDTLKERSRVFFKEELPDPVRAREDDPSDGYVLSVSVWEAIKKLSDRQREAIMLFYFAGFKQIEIATIMNIQRTTVAVLLSQARRRLDGLMGWSLEEGQK